MISHFRWSAVLEGENGGSLGGRKRRRVVESSWRKETLADEVDLQQASKKWRPMG